MIRLSTSDSAPLSIAQATFQPIVYLDQCVLFDLAEDSRLGDRFIKNLNDKDGTLCLSLTHIIETCGLDPNGFTFARLENFLKRIEQRWALLESSASKVIDREKSNTPDKPPPHLDLQMLQEAILSWDGLTIPSAALTIQRLRDQPKLRDKYRGLFDHHRDTTKSNFDKARNDYRTIPIAKKNLDGAIYTWNPSHPPTEFVYYSLMRESIRTNDVFTLKDGADFEHAAVATAYADFVVLDQKWTRRLKTIGLPLTAAKVYKVAEIDIFLQDLERFQRP